MYAFPCFTFSTACSFYMLTNTKVIKGARIFATPYIRAAESTNFKRLRLQLRLWAENIDSESNSDYASIPAKHKLLHPKNSNMMESFFDFYFDYIQKDDLAIQHPFALNADAAGRGYHWFH